MTIRANKFIDPPRHPLDLGFLRLLRKKLNALLNAKIVDETGTVIGTVSYSEGDTVYQFKSSGASTAIKGQWDPAAAYAAQDIVFFAPDGMAAGTYYALQAVPAGIAPDTGAPYWAAFPNSPPGVWA